MSKHWVWPLLCAALLAGWACAPRPTEPDPIPVTSGSTDTEPSASALFEERAILSGVDFTYRNGEDITPPHLAILESLGGGVALFDYDGDGLLDLFLPGGGYYDGPDKKQIKGHPCKLYKNLGGFRFQDITRAAGLDVLAGGESWFYSHGAAVADYDRDGWPDLLVTGWGRIALFRNVPDSKGGRRFLDVSEKAGLSQGITWANSAAWGDLDGDGHPDLYVCQYVDWSFANHPTCSFNDKTPDVCPPEQFPGLSHKVYRNQGNGRFTDESVAAGLRTGGPRASKGLGVLMVDVNLDGKPEIYVANDTVNKFLYVNHSTPGAIRLREEAMIAGVACGAEGRANGSMGLDAGDPDGSGRPWLWVTNFQNELHALYRNVSEKDRIAFSFHTVAAGIAAIGQQYVGWGTGFLDIDRHGFEDLVIVNGHVMRYPETQGASRRQKPVLLRNVKGKFKNITPQGGPYFREPHLSRGAALGDLDNDGRIDLVVSHLNEPVALLRNISSADNHWLGVELAGRDHADVIGARVILEAGGRRQTRFAKGGGSYASSGDRRHVFGLGPTDRIDRLRVVWPDGKQQEWTGLALDRYYRLTQGRENLESLPRQK